MSFINGSPLAGMGTTPAFEYERPESQNAQTVSYAATAPQYGDGFRTTPIALPVQYGGENGAIYSDGSSFGGSAYGSSNENSFLSSIMNSISGLMQQLASYFGSSAASGSASAAGTGYATTPSQTASPETGFNNVTASSTGDPHEAFNGTTAQGANVSDKWDSMKSHGDLLDSDSFRGGYQVSTTTTTPNANGVTYNSSATVTTQGGNDAVTLNKDGSYSVTENGRNVALTQGQATQIGHGETVTLNADKSLTVVDSNHQGGSLTTTLSLNGNGVDVNASGTHVDLGGYLVNKTDRDADPTAFSQQQPYQQYAGYTVPQTPANQYQQFLGEMQQQTPFQYGDATEPLGAGELEFA